jgi:fructuronate reductase
MKQQQQQPAAAAQKAQSAAGRPATTPQKMPALTLDGLEEKGWGEITLPKFNVREMVARTKAGAQWMHFAPSNLFTGEIAPRAQELLDEGLMQTGIVGVETWDEEIVTKVLHPHDNLRLRVVMPPDVADQSISVIASLADSLAAATQWEGVLAYFAQPSLQMVTVTCTEKGYGIANPAVEADVEAGPGSRPSHIMSIAAAGAFHRFSHGGAAPLAFVSMDNCSENGKLFQEAVMSIISRWHAAGKVGDDFLSYMSDPSKISFPWTMIDRITPRPDAGTVAKLTELGVADMDVVQTTKGTFIAPFSNTEHISYLAVQDAFPNGRPPLEKTGVIFAPDTEGVAAYEAMKVGTCLNPLHTTLAVFGCLLGHESIAGEMADPELGAHAAAAAAAAAPRHLPHGLPSPPICMHSLSGPPPPPPRIGLHGVAI